jgi:hypothetical protein
MGAVICREVLAQALKISSGWSPGPTSNPWRTQNKTFRHYLWLSAFAAGLLKGRLDGQGHYRGHRRRCSAAAKPVAGVIHLPLSPPTVIGARQVQANSRQHAGRPAQLQKGSPLRKLLREKRELVKRI